jgi:urease accessory protein
VTTVDAGRLAAGQGRIQVAHVAGASVVANLVARSPLRLLAPRNHGGAAWVFTASLGGGLVAGDAVRLEVEVGPGASALIATQAATKVYRSARTAGQQVELAARVGAGGLLVSLPDPVVCFAGASYRQRAQVDLAAGGSAVLVDAYTAGRSGRGERWAFRRYHAVTSIRYDGQELAHDALLLDPAHGELAGRMGRFDAWATVMAVGPRAAEVARDLLAVAPAMVRDAELRAAPSPLPSPPAAGLPAAALRLAGTRVEVVTHAVRAALRSLPALLGDDPFARKW